MLCCSAFSWLKARGNSSAGAQPAQAPQLCRSTCQVHSLSNQPSDPLTHHCDVTSCCIRWPESLIADFFALLFTCLLASIHRARAMASPVASPINRLILSPTTVMRSLCCDSVHFVLLHA